MPLSFSLGRISRPWLFAATVALGVVITLPSLTMGFFLDDYAQLALMAPWSEHQTDFFDLYSFLDTLPMGPWWTHEDFRVSMWRPVTSALLQLDYRLFGMSAFGYHAHSLLWLTGLLVTVALFYRRTLPFQLGLLACLIFALDESHTLTATWVANRHSMVAMVPAMLGLLAHLKWRREDWKPGLPLSLGLFALGLAGGEVALGVIAFAVGFEIIGVAEKRLAAGRWLTWRWSEWRPLMPLAGLGVVYVVFYKVAGYGSAHSGFYLDPTGDTLTFLAGAAGHLPTLFGSAFLGFPADLWHFAPQLQRLQILVGIAGILLVGGILFALRRELSGEERRAMAWLGLGTLGALLPSAVAQPFDRVLIAPMLGLAVFLGALLLVLFRAFNRHENPIAVRGAAALGLLVFGLLHVALPIAQRLSTQSFFKAEWRQLDQVALNLPTPEDLKDVDVIMPIAPDIVIGGFLPLMRGQLAGDTYNSWSIFSIAPYDHRVERVGPRSLEISPIDGSLLETPQEHFHRTPRDQMKVGDRVEGELFDIEILATTDKGLVQRFRVDIHRDLEDDPNLLFLTWKGDGKLQRWQAPAIGESTVVAFEAGPLEAATRELLGQ